MDSTAAYWNANIVDDAMEHKVQAFYLITKVPRLDVPYEVRSNH